MCKYWADAWKAGRVCLKIYESRSWTLRKFYFSGGYRKLYIYILNLGDLKDFKAPDQGDFAYLSPALTSIPNSRIQIPNALWTCQINYFQMWPDYVSFWTASFSCNWAVSSHMTIPVIEIHLNQSKHFQNLLPKHLPFLFSIQFLLLTG